MKKFLFAILTILSVASCRNAAQKAANAVLEAAENASKTVEPIVKGFDEELWENEIKPEMNAHLKFLNIDWEEMANDDMWLQMGFTDIDSWTAGAEAYIELVNNSDIRYTDLRNLDYTTKTNGDLDALISLVDDRKTTSSLITKVPDKMDTMRDYSFDFPVFESISGDRTFWKVYCSSNDEFYRVTTTSDGQWSYSLEAIY